MQKRFLHWRSGHNWVKANANSRSVAWRAVPCCWNTDKFALVTKEIGRSPTMLAKGHIILVLRRLFTLYGRKTWLKQFADVRMRDSLSNHRICLKTQPERHICNIVYKEDPITLLIFRTTQSWAGQIFSSSTPPHTWRTGYLRNLACHQ